MIISEFIGLQHLHAFRTIKEQKLLCLSVINRVRIAHNQRKSIMKKLIAITTVALCAFNANAAMESKSKVKFRGDTAYSSFCEAVVADDVKMLNKSFRNKVGEIAGSKSKVMALVTSEKGVKCNGASLSEFSKKRESTQVSAFLNKIK